MEPLSSVLFVFVLHRRLSPTTTPIHSQHTPPSAKQPHKSNPDWGYRCTDEVEAEARARGLRLVAIERMPANNFALVFRREEEEEG